MQSGYQTASICGHAAPLPPRLWAIAVNSGRDGRSSGWLKLDRKNNGDNLAVFPCHYYSASGP